MLMSFILERGAEDVCEFVDVGRDSAAGARNSMKFAKAIPKEHFSRKNNKRKIRKIILP